MSIVRRLVSPATLAMSSYEESGSRLHTVFGRIWDEWPRIEWALFLANVVFSSTFLTTFFVITVVNRDLRRIALLFLTWMFWYTRRCAYHFFRIIVDLLFFLLMKMLSKAVSAFQCAKNNFQDDPQERLLAEMEEAETYDEWYHAAAALDVLTGAAAWRQNPESHLYEWKALINHCQKLRDAREKEDIPGLLFLLRLCASRDFCGIANPLLFQEALTGTKHAIEAFTEEFCKCLAWLCYGAKIWGQQQMETQKVVPKQTDNFLAAGDVHMGQPGGDDHLSTACSTRVNSATQTPDWTALRRQPCDWRRQQQQQQQQQQRPATSCYCSSTDVGGNDARTVLLEQSPQGADFIDHINLQSPFSHVLSECSAPQAPLQRKASSPLKQYCGHSINTATRGPYNMLGPALRLEDDETTAAAPESVFRLLATLRLSLGRTALCLSGGGSLAMYHMGVVKTLLEQNCLPRVISGTSGGSIVAGVIGIHNDEELITEILRPEIVSRYGCRWFPPMSRQVRRFFLRGQMLDGTEFQKTCQAYYGDYTFKEAFFRTGRLISIVVTPASRAAGEALILNCINSPDVLIWSAVTASCALPGLLPPHELMAKGPDGRPVPYSPSGLKWMDGSLSQDLPVRELASLFNVKQVIVSQVNPHHAPFVEAHGRGSRIMRCLENWLTLDIKHRYAKLAKFQMIPRIFGQDISSFWMVQDFEGHVTITPQASLIDWYRMVNQPTLEDMSDFIARGEARTWPHCARISHMHKIERALRCCWSDLVRRVGCTGFDVGKAVFEIPRFPYRSPRPQRCIRRSVDQDDEPRYQSDQTAPSSTDKCLVRRLADRHRRPKSVRERVRRKRKLNKLLGPGFTRSHLLRIFE